MVIAVLYPDSFVGVVRQRLVLPFRRCGHEVHEYTDQRRIRGAFDIVFVHAMYPREINRDELRCGNLIPFDVADGTSFSQKADGYLSILQHCQFYAKMNYDAATTHPDNLLLIALPQTPMLEEGESARRNTIPRTHDRSPTINMTVAPTATRVRKDSVFEKHLGMPYVSEQSDKWALYCQRIQWFMDMKKLAVRYRGGLVFQSHEHHRLSLHNQEQKWGTSLHGYATPRLSKHRLRQDMLDCAISLCPTGNERISFRIFQIMSTGSIPVTTRFGSKRMLVMPDFYFEVEDFQDVNEIIDTIDIGRALEMARSNKKQMESVNPRSLTKAFLDQMR